MRRHLSALVLPALLSGLSGVAVAADGSAPAASSHAPPPAAAPEVEDLHANCVAAEPSVVVYLQEDGDDDGVDHDHDHDANEDMKSRPERRSERDSFTFEAYGQQSFDDGVGLGIGARLHPTRSAFIAAEGRGLYGSHWIGRGTIGLDIFGGSNTFDLTLGLFLGTVGAWAPVEIPTASPTAGFELGLGLNIGALRGRYRHGNGFRGPLEAHLTENEWRLGYQLGRAQVFGQYVRFNPGEEHAIGGFGAGAALTF